MPPHYISFSFAYQVLENALLLRLHGYAPQNGAVLRQYCFSKHLILLAEPPF